MILVAENGKAGTNITVSSAAKNFVKKMLELLF